MPICYLYRASLATGYLPRTRRATRVCFIPKLGKLDYSTAKAFRPISLTSFLLKGLEKLVDRYLRMGPLTELPLYPRQHAFEAGKSTESALHQLIGKIERTLSFKQYALGVFFDIEGAFDNSSPLSVATPLTDWQVGKPISNWIIAMIQKRVIIVTHGLTIIAAQAVRGLPQGGGLSPTLWSLVADSLLVWLGRQGVYAQGFADDGTVVVTGMFLPPICEIMQMILSASLTGPS